MGYIQDIEANRHLKDDFFKNNDQSPIPDKERHHFSGLKYFPIDEKLQFELELKIHANCEDFESADSAGNIRKFYRFGEFHFHIDDHEVVLQAYKSDLKESGLFIPFKDLTNGTETYGAGKYLDLEEPHHKTPDGKWILDFNLAYNPYCAYNQNYACPLTPFENHLKIPIKAGEKKYY